MRPSLICLFLFSSVLFAQAPEMVTRNYMLDQVPVLYPSVRGAGAGGGADPFGFGDSVSKSPGPMESDLPWARKTANPKFLEEYFTQHLGIEFTEGSWMTFQRAGNVLSMRNTEEQHAWLKLGLMRFHLIPKQVQLSLRMVQFENGVIDKLERAHPEGIPDATILAMWQGGKGETIASQSIKTVHGVNAIIECVDEIIYPTEMAYQKEDIEEDEEERLPEYGGLETRNIGAILNITPTQNASLKIFNLVILPENADLLEGRKEGPASLKPMTPLFRSLNVTSSVVIDNGATLVLGHSSSLDNKSRIFLLISAQMVDAKGSPVNFPITENEEAQP